MPPAIHSLTSSADFDPIARPYRWLEYCSFGPMLERCRFYRIPQLSSARRALILGDGDGRFLARLLAANHALYADVVDQSTAMLHLLQSRVAAIHAAGRIRIHHVDARSFTPAGPYDLVVTHFFLDCFSTCEVHTLAETLHPHLTPNALWLVSEFTIPSGIAALPAKLVISSLYLAFRLITGLRTRALPDHPAALAPSGLTLLSQKTFLFGLLSSELWTLRENPRNSAPQPHPDSV